MAGSARDVAASVGIAGALWNKPEAPAATEGPCRRQVRYLSACFVGSWRIAGGARREACGANAAVLPSNRLTGPAEGRGSRVSLHVMVLGRIRDGD